MVSLSLELAESALYKSQFDVALKHVELTYFRSFPDFAVRHDVLLTIKNLRIEAFKNRLFNLRSDRSKRFDELLKFKDTIRQINDPIDLADYYSMLSATYRSIDIDSCVFYEDKALELYLQQNNKTKIAEQRATRLSRTLDKYLEEKNYDAAIENDTCI